MSGKPLTKVRLYVGGMVGTGLPQISIGICVVAGTVFLFLGLMMPDYRIIALALGIVTIVTIPPIMLIVSSFLVLPGIFRIVTQERFFNMTYCFWVGCNYGRWKENKDWWPATYYNEIERVA